jgi:NADH-ubiquinone oxidoreductase chain 6
MIKNILIIKGLLSFCTLMACIITVTALNSVFSIIGLIFTFIFAASYLLFSGIDFIGISYIIIYVGAIAILFLFVILMINIEIKDIYSNNYQLYKNLPLGIFIFSILAYMFYNLLPIFYNNLFYLVNINNLFFNFNDILINDIFIYNLGLFNIPTPISQIESLGINLYTYHSILLILLGFILLLAMVASIELSVDRKK